MIPVVIMTTNFDTVSTAEDVIVNSGGTTARLPVASLATQIAGLDASYASVADLLASTDAARGAGTIYLTRDGHVFSEAAGGVADHHLTTAGGVKLYVTPVNGAVSLEAYGIGNGVAFHTAMKNAAETTGVHEIYVPAGDWTVSGDLNVQAYGDLWIRGAGQDATTLVYAQTRPMREASAPSRS